MRSPNKRSRSKSNRPKTLGNIVNRVFDSSGPEGKVRGTPQQIIDKYQVLARDAQLSNDRVAAENFQQHAEHYTRMLAQAQREQQAEQEARRQQQEERNRNAQDDRRNNNGSDNRNQQHHNQQHQNRRDDQRGPARESDAQPSQPQVNGAGRDSHDASAFTVQDMGEQGGQESGLVETPESQRSQADPAPEAEAPAKPANRRKPRAKKAETAEDGSGDAPAKPKRAPRKPRKAASEAESDQSTPSAAE